MNDEINYKNNPLHGVGLKRLLTEIVDHYGFELLYAYLNINCFKSNPSIESSLKFIKKTDWAREKIEAFYLYQFKNLPKPSADQLQLSPRDRIIPEAQTPGEPAVLSLEDAEQQREKREKRATEFDLRATNRPKQNKPKSVTRDKQPKSHREKRPQSKSATETQAPSDLSTPEPLNPWATAKIKHKN